MRKRCIRLATTREKSRHVESLERRLLLAAQPLPLEDAQPHRVDAPHIVRKPLDINALKSTSTATSIVATADVEADALVTVDVSGSALWTDANGATHPIPLATIEIRSTTEMNTDAPLATLQTDVSGNYSGSFTFDPTGGAITVFARVYAENPAATVKPDTGASAQVYSMDSATQTIAGAGTIAFPTRVASNSIVAEESFGLLGATLEVATYAADLAGPDSSMPSQLDVRFPSNEAVNGTASFFDDGTKQLFVTQNRVFDWDVIQHEYGHYVQDSYGFGAPDGGSHTFFVANPKPDGPGLAWNEGFATWFAISAQLSSGNPPYAAGVPEVGDTSFDPTGGPTANLATQTGVGELDEFSVAAALYHLSTGDEGVKISDDTLFQDFVTAKPLTFGAAWDAIAADASGSERSLIGKVLGLQNIAPVETAPGPDAAVSTGAIPTFTWNPDGSNDFVIQFYSSGFSTLIDQTADLGDVTSFTPSATEWAKIFNGNSTVKWVVEGMNTTAPATPGAVTDQTYGGTLDRYWSAAGTLDAPKIALVIDDSADMQNEINAIQTALVQYIVTVEQSLLPGQSAPTIELITFTNAPKEVISSSNVTDVIDAVGAILADGGGVTDASAASLEFAAQQIGDGGTILLATDAPSDPGSDLNSTIALLRAKGVTVNAIISGDYPDDIEPTGTIPVNTLSLSVPKDLPLPTDPSPEIVQYASVHLPGTTTGVPGGQSEPGGGSANDPDPPQGSISDPGQTPVADIGDTVATATRLSIDGPITRGVVGNTVQDSTGASVFDGSNLFVFHLIAGDGYNIPILAEGGGSINAQLLDSDATTVVQTLPTVIDDNGLGAATFSFTPTVTGDYYLNVTASGPSPYTVQVSDNPLVGATSSIALFSTAAAETGGEFLFKDAIATSTDPAVETDYQSSILNVLDGTFEPTVLSASPGVLPQGQTVDVTLTGKNTDWSQGLAAVSFSTRGITVNSVNVTSPTSLVASVTLNSAATTGFANATVQATLGTTTEIAVGKYVAQISAAPTSATLTQVQPTSLSQGQIQTTVTVIGSGTSWDSTSTLSLGPGITVTSVNVISPTKISAKVQVSPGAEIGFRMATITTGSDSDTEDRALMVGSATLPMLPAVVRVSPDAAVVGTQAEVDVTGVNTNFAAGVTTASFGPDVTVDSVEVIDATHAIVDIEVPASAPIGYQNVTMTTGTETAVLLNGFYIAPVITTPVITAPAAQTVFSGVNQAFNVGSFSAGGPGPWMVDVNWGDGTADTIFSTPSAGVLDPQDHMYTVLGNQHITVTVSNSIVPQYVGSTTSTISTIADSALFLTDPTRQSLSVAGFGALSVTGSGIVFVNSQSKTAAVVTGKRATASAFEFDVVGKTTTGGHFQGIVSTAQVAAENPLASLVSPAAPANVFKAVHDFSATPLTLQPGTYPGGIQIGGRASVTLAPGLYYLQRGGFSVGSHATVVGTGVTIYVTGRASPIIINGNVQLTAPTSGAYKGIVFFQDPTAGGNISIAGNLTLTGVFYAPSGTLSVCSAGRLTDNADPGDVIDALSIFSDVRISGRGNMTIDSANNTIAGLTAD